MVARVTLAELDTVRMSIEDGARLFEESIIPALREQDGYEGAYVFATPEGKAEAVTFWRDVEAAEAGIARGHYAEQVEKFAAVFRTPPGRELYQVVVADVPAAVKR